MGSRVSRVGRNGLIVVIVLWMMTELRDYVKYRKYKLANRVTSYLPFDLDFLARRMVDFYKPFEVLEIERQKHAKESGIMMSNILGRKAYFIFHPEIIKHTLSINWKNYDKGKRFIGAFKPLLGEGIFNSNGDQWHHHRTMARPHFAKVELTSMVDTFHRHLLSLSADLDSAINSTGNGYASVDMQTIFFEFTLASVGDVLMGTDVTKQSSLSPPSIGRTFASVFDMLQAKTVLRSFTFPFSEYIPDRAFDDGIGYLNGYCERIVAAALKDEKIDSRTDMLAEYIKSMDVNARSTKESHKYLVDMLKNMLIAGRDTTACLLTWTLYELSQNPSVLAKVLDEISAVCASHNINVKQEDGINHVTTEVLAELKYTKHVLYEVLRLHPSVPINVRFSVESEVEPFSGCLIEGGYPVIYSAYMTGRAKEYWGEDADVFDPDRFESNRFKSINPFAFVPFHAGPRICLGQNMAILEAKTALMFLLPRYSFTLNPKCIVDYRAAIILQAANGMVMDVRPRQG